MRHFGYLYETDSGEIVSQMNLDSITFPNNFTENGIIPRSEALVTHEFKSVHSTPYLCAASLLCLSTLVALIVAILSACLSESKIIKAASWKLNVLMCVGAILMYVAVVLYGLDERILSDTDTDTHVLNVMCETKSQEYTCSDTSRRWSAFVRVAFWCKDAAICWWLWSQSTSVDW